MSSVRASGHSLATILGLRETGQGWLQVNARITARTSVTAYQSISQLLLEGGLLVPRRCAQAAELLVQCLLPVLCLLQCLLRASELVLNSNLCCLHIEHNHKL